MLFPFHDDNPTVRAPVVTYLLIGVCTIGFLLVGRMPAERQREFIYHRGFVPARIDQLRGHKGPIQIPVERRVRHPFNPRLAVVQREQIRLEPDRPEIVASMFTCMFLHGGWMHLIGNMWFLWLFGNNVEDRLGGLVYLLLYLGGGLIASICHFALYPDSLTPVIGASGAVAAILGAYAITWPWARVHSLIFLFFFITVIDVPALFVLGLWFIMQLLSGTEALRQAAATGVAWWAHVGGFLAGLVLMPGLCAVIPGPKPKRRRTETEVDDAYRW